MSDPTTPNRGYTQPTVGGDANTWGGLLNENFALIDSNLGANDAITASGTTNVTVSDLQAENLTLTVSGTLTGNIALILPALGGFHFIRNSTTGGHAITATTASPGDTVAIAAGTTTLVGCDGTNVFGAVTAAAILSAQGALRVGPLIVQWGNDQTAGAGATKVVTFPAAFSTVYQVYVTSLNYTGIALMSAETIDGTQAGFASVNSTNGTPLQPVAFSWMAIGRA